MIPRIVIPGSFKLACAGIVDDTYAVDGWHFRWFISPDLGLPRYPFELWVRGSSDSWDWASENFTPRHQAFAASNVVARYTDARLGYRGCQIYRPSGAAVAVDGGVALGDDPLFVDLRHPDPPVQPPPSAAIVELHILLEDRNGWAEAVAETYTTDGFQTVDQASYHPLQPATLVLDEGGSTSAEPVEIEMIETPVSDVPRPAEGIDAGPSVLLLDENLEPLPSIQPETEAVVAETFPAVVVLRLSGEHIHRIQVTGNGLLMAAHWLDTQDYVDNGNWDSLETVLFPLEHPSSPFYHNDNFSDERPFSTHRLMRGRGKAPAPWRQPVIPPPLGTARPTEGDYDARYIRSFEEHLAGNLRKLLEQSFSDGLPQRSISETVTLPRPRGGDGKEMPVVEGDFQSTVEVPLLASTLFGAMDYHMARFLGLATVRTADMLDTSRTWDFKLECRYDVADIKINDPKFGEKLERRGLSAVVLTSFASYQRCARRALPAPPKQHAPQLLGRATPDSQRAAHVKLSWDPPPQTPARSMTGVGVMVALARQEVGKTPISLNPVDEKLKITLPYLPARVKQRDGRQRETFTDLTLPQEGAYDYLISTGDMWGRWSPWSRQRFEYVDDRRPIPPANVQAHFIDPDDPLFEEDALALEWYRLKRRYGYPLRVSFEWTEDHQNQSPEVKRFSIRVRRTLPKGDERRRDARAWRHVEFSVGPANHKDPITIDLSGAKPSVDPGNTPPKRVNLHPPERFTRTVKDENGNLVAEIRGTRYTVDIAGFQMERPGVAMPRQWLYVGVMAHGKHKASEVGGPGGALLLYRRPPRLIHLKAHAWSSYTDATGRSNYELAWKAQAGMRYTIYRANENTLLAAAADAKNDPVIQGWVGKFKAKGARSDSRAKALRELAACARLRRAFERLNDAPWPAKEPAEGQQVIYRDELPGHSNLRYVYCVVGLSPTGMPGKWPPRGDYFTVVQVPAYVVPDIPKWDAIEEKGGTVHLRFNIRSAQYDGKKAAREELEAIEIYRCIDPERAGHVRHMRRLGEASCKWEKQWVEFEDDTVRPWRRYYYRAVARGPAVKLGSTTTPGVRSPASGAMSIVLVDSDPPAKPEKLRVSLTRSAKPQLTWSSSVPIGPTPLGSFRMAIWRQDGDGQAWNQVTVRDASDLVKGDGFAYEEEEKLPEKLDRVAYRVRVIDPLRRYTDSDVVVQRI